LVQVLGSVLELVTEKEWVSALGEKLQCRFR
jgi:hypothetical protein